MDISVKDLKEAISIGHQTDNLQRCLSSLLPDATQKPTAPSVPVTTFGANVVIPPNYHTAFVFYTDTNALKKGIKAIRAVLYGALAYSTVIFTFGADVFLPPQYQTSFIRCDAEIGPTPTPEFARTITINHTKCGSSDSTDFPMYLSVTDDALKSTGNGGHVQSIAGYDIRPYTNSGLATELSYQLKTYDPATGRVTMRVKVPTLSHTSDTVYYLGYGDASKATDGSSTSTWSNNYAAQWDLNIQAKLADVMPLASSATATQLLNSVPMVREALPVFATGQGGFFNYQSYNAIIIVNPTDSSKLIMFFNGGARSDPFGAQAIGRATGNANDPYTWTLSNGGSPVLEASESYEGIQIVCNSVLYNADDEKLYMYYTAYGTPFNIACATSTDLGLTWAKQGSVLVPSDDESNITHGSVLLEGSDLHMAYTFRTGPTAPGFRYAHASTSNWLSWTKGSTIYDNSSEPHLYVEDHQLIKVGSTYILAWETGNPSKLHWELRTATSSDPSTTFTLANANPFMDETGLPGTFDRYHLGTPRFYIINGFWYLYYDGGPDQYLPWNLNHYAMGITPLGTQPAIVATDSTSNGNDGTIAKCRVTAGQVDGAAAFIGSLRQDIDCGNGSSLNITGDLTLSAWVYMSRLPFPSPYGIITKYNSDASDKPYFLVLYNDGPHDFGSADYMPLFGINGGAKIIGSNVNLDIGTLYKIDAVYDSSGQTLDMYVNGASAHAQVTGAPSSIVTATTHLYVGSQREFVSGPQYYYGRIDEPSVSNAARSPDWILQMYNSESDPNSFFTLGPEVSKNVPEQEFCGAIWLIDWLCERAFHSRLTLGEGGQVEFQGEMPNELSASATLAAVDGQCQYYFRGRSLPDPRTQSASHPLAK